MEICPELHYVRSYEHSIHYYNIFRDTLDWHEQFYRFSDNAVYSPDYAYAINLNTVNYCIYESMSLKCAGIALNF